MDIAEELSRLVALHNEKLLSDKDFQSQRSTILELNAAGELTESDLFGAELTKLAALFRDGMMSRSDFEQQKNALIWDEAESGSPSKLVGNEAEYEAALDQVVRRFSRGPGLVATVFKGAAGLVLILGISSAAVTGIESGTHGDSTAYVVGWSVGQIVSAVFLAATLAFFGYVLDLLIDMRVSNEVVAQMALFPVPNDPAT